MTATAVVCGWKVLADYAEPVTAGGGYVEVQTDGEVTVAYEVDQSARDMGLDPYLLTRIPVDVMRTLLDQYDARQVAPHPDDAENRWNREHDGVAR